MRLGRDVLKACRAFLAKAKSDDKEVKELRLLALKGTRRPLVGKSAGLSAEGTLLNQAHIEKRCNVSQSFDTKIAITSLFESPRVTAARTLLLST